MSQKTIRVGTIDIANDKPFVLFGGINVMESRDLAMRACEEYVRGAPAGPMPRPAVSSFDPPKLNVPGKVLSTKREMAIKAPVLPAETTACAEPSLTRSIATRMDESFFARIATTGDSSMATTSDACRTCARSPNSPREANTESPNAEERPTRTTRRSGSARKQVMAAGIVTEGP